MLLECKTKERKNESVTFANKHKVTKHGTKRALVYSTQRVKGIE